MYLLAQPHIIGGVRERGEMGQRRVGLKGTWSFGKLAPPLIGKKYPPLFRIRATQWITHLVTYLMLISLTKCEA